jgi:hypothetical protein
MCDTWMAKPSLRLGFVEDLVLAIADIAWYNTLMNKQEAKQIDEATANAEASLIIDEALHTGHNFAHYLLGWMMAEHSTEMAEAAESWIEIHNNNNPKED